MVDLSCILWMLTPFGAWAPQAVGIVGGGRRWSAQQNRRAQYQQRTGAEEHHRPAALRPRITALRTALPDQGAFILVRGREHAGKAAAGRSGIGLESEQRGSGAAIPACIHDGK